MISLTALNAEELATLMDQRYPNWESIIGINSTSNYVKIYLLVVVLDIDIDVGDIKNDGYLSRRFKNIWKHIVKNEDRLILWRLL